MRLYVRSLTYRVVEDPVQVTFIGIKLHCPAMHIPRRISRARLGADGRYAQQDRSLFASLIKKASRCNIRTIRSSLKLPVCTRMGMLGEIDPSKIAELEYTHSPDSFGMDDAEISNCQPKRCCYWEANHIIPLRNSFPRKMRQGLDELSILEEAKTTAMLATHENSGAATCEGTSFLGS